MRHLRAWVVFWVGLFWLWFLVVGEWNRIELIAAACAAAVGASIAELVRTKAEVSASLRLRTLAALPGIAPQIFVDFALLVVALVRRDRGTTLRRPFHDVGDDPASVGVRAFSLWAASLSPNAIGIDIDRAHEQSIVHDVITRRRSEIPL